MPLFATFLSARPPVFLNSHPAFCCATAPQSPTISSAPTTKPTDSLTTKPTTSAPTKKPTEEPTSAPTKRPTGVPSDSRSGKGKSGKTAKDAKLAKSSTSAKSDKSAKSESAKSGKSASASAKADKASDQAGKAAFHMQGPARFPLHGEGGDAATAGVEDEDDGVGAVNGSQGNAATSNTPIGIKSRVLYSLHVSAETTS